MSSHRPRNNLAARMGRWSATHWKTATFGWLAFVVVAFMLGNNVGTKYLDPQKNGAGESGHVQAVLADEWKQSPEEAVVVQAKHGTSRDPSFRRTVDDLIVRLRGVKQVKEVTSPYRHSTDTTISKDGRTVLVALKLRTTDFTQAKKDVVPVEDAVAAFAKAHPAATFDQLGDVSSEAEIDKAVSKDMEKAGILSLPVTLAVLLVAFGALIAAGVPVVLSLTAVIATMGLVALPSHLMPIDSLTGVVVLLIGLAVGVDYSMFYLKREREERRAGRDTLSSIEAAAATSGRAVLISGLTVIVAMAGMLFTGDKTFSSFAIGTMLVVAAAVLGSLTVLPALLARLGDKIDRGRLPFRRRRRPCSHGESRFWNRLLNAVLHRPAIAAALAAGLLVALAVPAFQMRTDKGSFEMLAPNLKVTKAFKKMSAAFPTGSKLVPAQVMVKAGNVHSPQVEAAVGDLRTRALASGDFEKPIDVASNPQGTISLVTIPIAGNGTNAKSQAALDELRGTIVPATVGKLEGADVGVTGGAASNDDFNKQMKRAAPFVFAFVLGLAFLLLLVTFRSLVVAAKAVVLNLLSVAAAYGVLVLVFQHGFGKNLLGFDYTGGIVGFLPIFLFVILFGLSMDYHVFILSRIREAYTGGMSNEDAVAYGIKSTAAVVTSAAAVMVGVFSIFASLSFLFLKQFGVGLAIAVLLDATVVRAVLLPATMKLLGDWNWYLPRWLEWLPRLDHEPGAEAPPAPALGRAA